MLSQNNGDFKLAYSKHFGKGTAHSARDVTRYLLALKNPDGSAIDKNNSLDWVKEMVLKDPQFLSRSPVEQFKAMEKAGYKVSQNGPWPHYNMPTVSKAGKTWKTDKSDISVDFGGWGFPIFDNYAVAVVNLADDETMKHDRKDHLISATKLLASDKSGVQLALSQLPEEDRVVFEEGLRRGDGKLKGYTWHHAGHEYGRMLLIKTEIHQAFTHTGWDSTLRHAKIRNLSDFKMQRELGKAMDDYSGCGKGNYEVGKFYRQSTSPHNLTSPQNRTSYTSMKQAWQSGTRDVKRSRQL